MKKNELPKVGRLGVSDNKIVQVTGYLKNEKGVSNVQYHQYLDGDMAGVCMPGYWFKYLDEAKNKEFFEKQERTDIVIGRLGSEAVS